MFQPIFQLNHRYPVYDDDDNLVGRTSEGDKVIITSVGDNVQGYEALIISGKYAGYDSLFLNERELTYNFFLRGRRMLKCFNRFSN